MADLKFDVAVIGGGPGGATLGGMLRKYDPEIRVGIFEREMMPRDHVGESLLPPVCAVLDELGCWDKMEAADFPVKFGATYRWGQSEKLWDFEFMPLAEYQDEPRPAKFEGQRTRLSWQVDRAVYDKILLDHVRELGCDVFEGTAVKSIDHDGDRVTGFTLANDDKVTADYYVDASGSSGLLRRAMGVEIDAPTKLRNIALWDYWDNAEWAVEYGVAGATRILVLSLGYGWIWFIPLSRTRTSIGFVCPAEYYRKSGLTTEELYQKALSEEAWVAKLTRTATRENKLRTTKDWSFVADRIAGENWFLVGECAGFADPILSAGMTLTHGGAREAAFSICELRRGEVDGKWIRDQYDSVQKRRIMQHIRFADFWYTGNGIFTDLQEYTREIAEDAGLDLDAKKAFQWLGTGGFANDHLGQPSIGGYDLTTAKQLSQRFHNEDAKWSVTKFNLFELDTSGAIKTEIPAYSEGRVIPCTCWVRGKRRLPMVGLYALVASLIEQKRDIATLMKMLEGELVKRYGSEGRHFIDHAVQTLEVMLADGWVKGKLDPRLPRLNVQTPVEGAYVHTSELFQAEPATETT